MCSLTTVTVIRERMAEDEGAEEGHFDCITHSRREVKLLASFVLLHFADMSPKNISNSKGTGRQLSIKECSFSPIGAIRCVVRMKRVFHLCPSSTAYSLFN